MFRTVANGRYAPLPYFHIGETAFDALNLAALPDGFVATWSDGPGTGVHAQRFDNNGRKIGSEIVVAGANPHIQPSVTALSSGRFVLTWTEEVPFLNGFDIRGQLFDANGDPIGQAFGVNTTVQGFQTQSVVAGLAGGGFVVTWLEPQDHTFDRIRGQVFSADGTKIGNEFIANDAMSGDKALPMVTGLAEGGFVISWFDFIGETDGQGNFDPGTRAQLFDAAGNKVGSSFPLNTPLPGSQSEATLAALPSGGFVAAWADNGAHSSGTPQPQNQGIWIQIFDASGAKLGAAKLISDLGPPGRDMPSIQIVPNIGFMLTWRDFEETPENSPGQLRAQLLDFEGNEIGSEFAVDPHHVGVQSFPDVIALANGALVIGWRNEIFQSSQRDVQALMLIPVDYGTEGNDSFVGTADRDFYAGLGGDDLAAGAAEADTLDGADGNDNLAGEDGDDTLTGDVGDDLLYGGAGGDMLDGGTGADRMEGGAGNDFLSGGTDDDAMAGGQGNDTMFVDSGADTIVELTGEGYDVVAASLSWTLTAGAHVELMTTGWIEGTAVIHLAGNELDQQIWGNAAANIISGNDGDDTLFGFGGADILLGNAGKDVFFGGAGANDSLYGGTGNDTYFADDAGDVIVENAGEGQDVAAASIDYVLGAGASIELMTTGFIGGAFTLALTGNELGNEIWGNNGVNQLNGGGGNVTDALFGFGGNDRLDGGGGLDLLVGGTGQDSFVFANALAPAEADIIADFSSVDDTILLDDAVFAGLGLGALNPNTFVAGTAALDADDRIIYDAATGKLWFDADGNGAGAAIQFATLSGNPALTASDFAVF